ncbi:MAG: class I adenylate-forming enzyme family protein [Acetobacteraceae bacterium]
MIDTIPWAADLAAVVGEHGQLTAVHDGDRGISFTDMAGRAARLAMMLREAGATPGEPVASSLPNSIEAVWVSIGLRIAGVAETPLNAGYSDDEKAYCVGIAGVRRVVTTSAQAAAFASLGCAVITVEDMPDTPGSLTALPPVPGNAWGRILFTSGTTGRPKAIVYTHAARWIGAILQRASFETMPGPGSAVLLMTPFVHGAGLLTQGFHERGGTAHLLNGVDLPRVRDTLDHGRVDHIFAPPTPLAKIVADYEGRRIEGIRTIFCGTAPLLPSLYAKARAMFGPVVRVTYGKTEVINPITVLPPRATDFYYAEAAQGDGVCVGWPGSGVEVQIRDETGAVLGTDEVGEVFLRARHMYHGHLDANGFHPLPADGFHDTGDLGRIDARGRLHLVGRLADVIKSGGYKIYPDEIERVLTGTAGTGAVSVVSLPSEYWGEIIVAVAETNDAGWPDRAQAALAAIARFKHPRALLMQSELPRNAQGKVMRRTVREMVLQHWRVVDGPYPRLEMV